ncbi:class I SAM-dependent methyltransferase [Alphaproteobacteria bacterium]|nr:class I SAM-dependent methyltransferase [Alphaproteobacteria bacterium]
MSQDLRLNIILDKITNNSSLNNISIGDVGCGYGRLFEIIKERKLDDEIIYSGFDINKEMVLFCKKNKYFHNVSFKIGTFPTQNVDYVVMSGTYNLTVIKNIKIWESYIVENLKSNWNYAKKALIFNCLVDQNRKIQKNLYYTELSWIKNICEQNFGNFECIKHNMLPNDITIIVKKLG